ncbi:hypothetical protein BJ165DRAFT_769455 [Panaeolus papilionaceus]|nr:hypothetical protein BJ165DRAFT_769455 [Panaeolus papilionaceus]
MNTFSYHLRCLMYPGVYMLLLLLFTPHLVCIRFQPESKFRPPISRITTICHPRFSRTSVLHFGFNPIHALDPNLACLSLKTPCLALLYTVAIIVENLVLCPFSIILNPIARVKSASER